MSTPVKQPELPLNHIKGQKLSAIETKILEWLTIEGYDYGELAAKIYGSTENKYRNRINTHMHRIRDKLGARSTIQAIWFYSQRRTK